VSRCRQTDRCFLPDLAGLSLRQPHGTRSPCEITPALPKDPLDCFAAEYYNQELAFANFAV